jgi:hypothetical protein
VVRVGLINRDDLLHVLRLRISVLDAEGRRDMRAQVHWNDVLPRRASQGLDVIVDFAGGSLSVAHDPTSSASLTAPGGVYIVRAELLGDDGNAYDCLEVGVRHTVAGFAELLSERPDE